MVRQLHARGAGMEPGMVVLTGGILLVGIVGLFGSACTLTLGRQVAIFAIIILGLNLPVGHGGQIVFGDNAFFGIDGHISALASPRGHVPHFGHADLRSSPSWWPP